MRQLADLRPFVLGLGFGRGRDGVDELRDLDVLGLAAAARHGRLELRIVALADLDIGIDHEDHLAPLRAETSCRARSGRPG